MKQSPGLSDQDLLRRHVRDPHGTAFSQLRARYEPLVYRACWTELQREDWAQDAAQATFLVFHEKASKLTHIAHLGPWLYTSARFISQNLRRKETTRTRYEAEAMSSLNPETAAESTGPIVELQAAIAKLSAADRIAILDRYYAGLSIDEIAKKHSISVSAAQMRVSRATTRLKNRMVRMGVPLTAVTLVTLLDACPAQAALSEPSARVIELVSELGAVIRTPLPLAVALRAASLATLIGLSGFAGYGAFRAWHRQAELPVPNTEIHRQLDASFGGLYVGDCTLIEKDGTKRLFKDASLRIYMPPDASRVTMASLLISKTITSSSYEPLLFDRKSGKVYSAEAPRVIFDVTSLSSNSFELKGKELFVGPDGTQMSVRVTVKLTRTGNQLSYLRSYEYGGVYEKATGTLVRVGDSNAPPVRPKL